MKFAKISREFYRGTVDTKNRNQNHWMENREFPPQKHSVTDWCSSLSTTFVKLVLFQYMISQGTFAKVVICRGSSIANVFRNEDC